MSAEKEALRAACKAQIAALTPQQNAAISKAITKRLLALAAYQTARTVFCFAGRSDEIDTAAFVQTALQDGKRVCLPRCGRHGSMTAHQIYHYSELRPGAYGILEPSSKAEAVPPQAIDFCVLPCLAADLNGHRLGYGAGYYDRFLPQCSAVITAAVCRSTLLQKELPTQPHDVAATYVITEQQTILCP